MRYLSPSSLVAAVVLAGCVTPPNHPLAVLEAPEGPCVTLVDFETATSLERPRPQVRFMLNEAVAADTPCLMTADGAHTPYLVFDLDGVPSRGSVMVGGAMGPYGSSHQVSQRSMSLAP
ncbi:MAG: hypothetical protein AAGI89_10895 [Pseudomonadota bacterium]